MNGNAFNEVKQTKTNKLKEYDVIIIGSGPAGLFAAVNIKNKSVLLLEKNNSLGKKLLISGAGQCNVTHDGEIKEFFSHYGDNSKFIKDALYRFSNTDLKAFLAINKIDIVIDKNKKIFPASYKADHILKALEENCKKNKVEIKTNSAVTSVESIDNSFIIETTQQKFKSKYLIIATGGKSYPSTGSDGDGYTFAKSLGHTIKLTKPALTPVFVNNFAFSDVSGISLSQKTISLYRNNKKIKEHKGDIVFTHKGISGPGILDFSRFFELNDFLKINLCDLNPEVLKVDLVNASENQGKTLAKNYLKKFAIPESLIIQIFKVNNINLDTKMAVVSREQRLAIVSNLCEFKIPIDKIGAFNIAMATTGGISLSEINPKTMESKIIPNLFFAGEVIDIDGDTGGYNIQAAFSMGFLCAMRVNEIINQTINN